jgi:uncharacterized NAD(P)/FAD-binding protein YdhS
MKLAKNLKIDAEESYLTVNSLVMELVNILSPSQQLKFVTTYGQKIGRYYRRAGSDYLDKVKKLRGQKKIKFIKGDFLNVNQSGFHYKTPLDGNTVNFIHPLDIIINCSGSTDLTSGHLKSDLINNLINQKICKVNPSEKGFFVNAKFETDKNFYVIGPLLAGNIVGNHKIWHAESCNRIFNLTFDLAGQIFKEVFC